MFRRRAIIGAEEIPIPVVTDTVLSLSAGSQRSITLNIYKTDTVATQIYLDDALVTTSTTSGTQDISVTIPSGTSTLKISGGTFYFDDFCLGGTINNALLTEINFGNNYGNIIGHYAFEKCSGLTSITIPNSVTNIMFYAFYNCTGLTNITIPNSVTSIGYSAFGNCSGLTSITIPDGVTSIGISAFDGCSSLNSITINATTPPTLTNTNAFDNTNDCPIYVPSASVSDYQSATNWSSLSSRIQAKPV